MTCPKCQGLMVHEYGDYRCVNCGKVMDGGPVQRRPRTRRAALVIRDTPADQAGEAGSAPAGRSSSTRPKIPRTCEDCGAEFIGTAQARLCRTCRSQHLAQGWARRKKYHWTPERLELIKREYDGRVKHRAAAIARKFGWPTWVVKKQAQKLGLTYAQDRKDWTKDEVAFLERYVGRRTVQWMVKRLPGRTMTTVVLKLKRMGISRKFRKGYTLCDLELCFGIDHHGIDRWIAEGKLCGRRRGTDRQGEGGRPLGHGQGPADPWVFTDQDVVAFITHYPTAFRLDKVDQVWFMELLLGGCNVLHALDQKWALEESAARLAGLRLGAANKRDVLLLDDEGRELVLKVGERLQDAVDRAQAGTGSSAA